MATKTVETPRTRQYRVVTPRTLKFKGRTIFAGQDGPIEATEREAARVRKHGFDLVDVETGETMASLEHGPLPARIKQADEPKAKGRRKAPKAGDA